MVIDKIYYHLIKLTACTLCLNKIVITSFTIHCILSNITTDDIRVIVKLWSKPCIYSTQICPSIWISTHVPYVIYWVRKGHYEL